VSSSELLSQSCFGRSSGITGQDKQVIVALLPGSHSVLVVFAVFPWGQFSPSLLIHILSVSPVLSFLDSKIVTGENGLSERHRYKIGARNVKFFSCF
jgi:hypothetical protein